MCRRAVVPSLAVAMFAALGGCGGDSSGYVCFGDAAFCAAAFDPVARAGADQFVASGDSVTLDGSDSTGGGSDLKSYAWVQTGGTAVTLVDAGRPKASFVAPSVAAATELTFKLTVVNATGRADSASTVVTGQTRAAAALATALALFDGPLQPLGGIAAGETCPSATAALSDDAAAAQTGLFLAARTLAIVNGADPNDPSAFFDTARALTAAAPSAGGVAGAVQTFGFVLLRSLATERDPALAAAIERRLHGAPPLDDPAPPIDDPAALLAGRNHVTVGRGVAVEPVDDVAAARARANAALLAHRATCPAAADAVALSAAGLLVIVDALLEADAPREADSSPEAAAPLEAAVL